MQRRQDTNGRGRWLGLLGVSASVLVAGCGWFGGGSATPSSAPPRPGVDREVAPSAALPPPTGGRAYEQGIVAVDETRGGAAIGSIVAGKGGQKAQKEALEKEQIERDRKDREARLEREAEDKVLRAREKEAETERSAGGVPPPGAAPGTAPALDTGPAAVPVVPLPAPVTTTPMPAPSTDAAPGTPPPSAAPSAPAPEVPAAPATEKVPEKQSALPAGTRFAAASRTDIHASL